MRLHFFFFVAAGLAGCNLVFGLEEPTERTSGGGGSTATSESTSSSSSSTSSSTSSVTTASTGSTGGTSQGGGGDGGGGGCPGEETAGPGAELLGNGSFEQGESGWNGSNVLSFNVTFDDSFCGCQSGIIVLDDGYQELRGALPTPEAGTVRAHVRLRAPDNIDADVLVRVDNANVDPPAPFEPDALDAEGVDGWRTADGQWQMPTGSTAYFAVSFLSARAGDEVLVDCGSLTFEP